METLLAVVNWKGYHRHYTPYSGKGKYLFPRLISKKLQEIEA